MKLLNEIRALLDDDDLGVRQEVIYFLCLKDPEHSIEILSSFLTHENPRLQTAAIAAMAEHQMIEANELLTEDALEIFLVRTDEDAETGRIEVAKLLGLLEGEHYSVFLAQLMADTSHRVVKAAISSAGRKRDVAFVPHLIELLGEPAFRPDAKGALAYFGSALFPTLSEHLLSDTERRSIRINIPSVISRIEAQESVDLLTTVLHKVRPDLKFYVVKALNRLRNSEGRLKFPRAMIDDIIIQEARNYFQLIQILHLLPENPKRGAERLLQRALAERRDLNFERIFRLLGLCFPSRDIYSAYLGLTSNNRLLRANALEFLDNLLKGEVKRHLVPLLEEVTPEILTSRGEGLFQEKFVGLDGALAHLIQGDDTWLKSCALYCLAGRIPTHLRIKIELLSSDSNKLVSETARLALSL